MVDTALHFPRYGQKKIRLAAILVGWACVCALYLYFFAFRAQIQIDINLLSEGTSLMEVFWESGDRRFSPEKSRSVPVQYNRQTYTLDIGNLGSISKIRIDPVRFDGQLEISRIEVTQAGYEPIVLDSDNGFRGLHPVKDIYGMQQIGESLLISTRDRDSQLVFYPEIRKKPGLPIIHILNLILITVAWIVISRYASPDRREGLSAVPVLLIVPFTLALIMASITSVGVHPDEWVHNGAVQYYGENLFPPSIEDPAIAETFSPYGKSRLSGYESYYFAAGYFTRLLVPFNLSELLEARLFNVLLLAILILMATRKVDFRYFAAPLLISAQAWYLYGYINSDAYSVFLVLFMAYQAAAKQSLLNQFLMESNPQQYGMKMVFLGLFFGSLILLKPNYYVFLIFLLMYLLWRIGIGDFQNRKILFARLGLVVLMGLSLPALRYALDVRANGFDTLEKYEQMIEEKASYIYKPSTPKKDKFANLALRDRGITLDQLLQNKKWAGITFLTSFGSYGFTQYNPGPTYMQLLHIVVLLLFLTVVISVLVRAPPRIHCLVLIAIFCVALLLGISLWASWVVNYQPQGRYMAPLLGIFGVVFYHVHPYLIKRVFYPLAGILFLMATYSFIYTGLRLIEKAALV